MTDNEQLNNNVVSDNEENNEVENKKRNPLWKILIIISIILLLLGLWSFGAVILRIGKLLPNYTDIIVLVPIWPDSEVVDKEQVWTSDTNINIFSAKYSNEHGQITVESHDGRKVIAPGTKGTYEFVMRNKGNVALNTTCKISTILDTNFDIENLPIEVRLRNHHGKYLVGGYNEWVSFDKMEDYFKEEVIGRGRYIAYELDWRWSYEGNDEFDTELGNLAIDEDITLTINIETTAEQHDDPFALGGVEFNDVEVGGDFDLIPYIILNIIIMIIIIILVILEIIKRKKYRQEKEDEVNEKESIN